MSADAHSLHTKHVHTFFELRKGNTGMDKAKWTFLECATASPQGNCKGPGLCECSKVVTDDVVVKDSLIVYGNTTLTDATVNGELTANGQSTFYNNVYIQDPLNPNLVIHINPFAPNITLSDGINFLALTPVGVGGTAVNSDNLKTTLTSSALTFYPSFTIGTTGYQTNYSSTGYTFQPSTNTLTASTFSGALAGNAATASQVNIVNDPVSAGTHYVVFTSSFAGNNTLNVDNTGFTYDPFLNTLTCANFAGTASDAATCAITTSSAALNYVSFVSALSGNLPHYVNASLTFDASGLGNLATGTFTGALSGTATNASNVGVTNNTSSAATWYPSFVQAASGNNPITVSNTGLTFQPSTNTLTCANFAGNASTATSATNASNIAVASGSAATNYVTFVTSTSGNVAAKVNTSLTFDASGSGNLATGTFTGALSGTATNASNIAITDTTAAAGTYYPTFTSASTGNNVLRTDSTGLTYSPSTDTLTVANVTGAASKFGTTLTSFNGVFYLTFVASNSTSVAGQAANVATALTFNPNIGNLTSTTFNSSSDYRIKEQVQPIDNRIRFDELKPKHYYNTRSLRHEYGFIAHELQEVVPEAVTGEKDDPEQMQSVNYLQMIAVLVNEVQQLRSRVQQLEQAILK